MSQQKKHTSIIPELGPHTKSAASEPQTSQREAAPTPPAPPTGKGQPVVQEPHKGGGLGSQQVAQMTDNEQETEANMALEQAEGVDDTSES